MPRQLPTVNINGLRVAYRDAGLGLPIVLLHGLTGSKEWFEYQFSGLSSSYRVLSYDLRTAGRRHYDIQLLAEDLAKFLSALRIPSAMIGGHSLGGLVAQQFALSYPQRTKGLILVSTFPYLHEKSPQMITKWITPGEVQFQSPTKRLFSRIFGGRKREASVEPEGLEFLAANTAGLNKATLHARIKIVQEIDFRERLAELNMPALIVVGAKDEPVILEGAQLLYEGLSDATLEVIENTGHFCFYERHDLFNNAVDYFLAERLANLA